MAAVLFIKKKKKSDRVDILMFPKQSHVLDVSCKCEQTGLLWKVL